MDIESRRASARPTEHSLRREAAPPAAADVSTTPNPTDVDQQDRQRGPAKGSTGQLRPRFPDGDCSQAPRGPQDMEVALQQVKRRIIAAYKNHRSPDLNYSAAQMKSLKDLASNKEVIVKRSDKCKGLVLINSSDYMSKMQNITQQYDDVPKNPTPKLEAATKRVIHETLDGKVDDKIVKSILPQCSRTAELYGLPKDHKTDIPLRPIVSACDDPVDKLTWILERVITQLLPFIPTHLKNTTQFLAQVREKFPLKFEPGTILFSVDVVNLYGNIPVEEGIAACMTILREHEQKVNTFGMTLSDIETLLKHSLTQNFVRFGSKYHRQRMGIAMGSRVAPPLAITFMHVLESMFLSCSRAQPSLYLRYIDDVFGVWPHGLPSLMEYFAFLNTVHPFIKFTLEHSGTNGTLSFLDTLFTITDTGDYTTELYIKPCSANVILHFDSAQPMSVKKATARSQFLRALRISSPGQPAERSQKKISQLFKSNGYPPTILRRAQAEATQTYNRESSRPFTRDSSKQKSAEKTPLVLPFVDDKLCHRIQGIVKQSGLNFQVAWRGGESVGHRLIRSALTSPPCPGGGRHCNTCDAGLAGACHTKNTVYRIDCKLCQENQAFYIGESRRAIRKRFNEHLGDARNRRADSPFGIHQGVHPETPLTSQNLSVRILSRAVDGPDRKIKESIFIRDQKPTLNTQTSSWPLTPTLP